MEIQLHGKKAVVTGSSQGIGLAVAIGLVKAGASVLINGRNQTTIGQAIEKIKMDFPKGEVFGFMADLSTKDGIEQLLDYWPETDILVNNLGIFEPKPFFEITDEDWENYIDTNLMSGVRLSRYYGRKMVEKGWGRILFNGSVTSGFFPGEMVHYGATKGALLALSRGIAESVAGSGLTVNTFIPGPTRTERNEGIFKEMAIQKGVSVAEVERDLFDSGLPSSLLGRFISAEEVANLAVFLSSEQASAITGSAFHVDGGIVRDIV